MSQESGQCGQASLIPSKPFQASPEAAFCFVRPAGRIHLRVQVPYEPGRGIVSRTARVSITSGIRRKPQAKRWPDEQKPHKRRGLDEKAKLFKDRYLHGKL